MSGPIRKLRRVRRTRNNEHRARAFQDLSLGEGGHIRGGVGHGTAGKAVRGTTVEGPTGSAVGIRRSGKYAGSQHGCQQYATPAGLVPREFVFGLYFHRF